GAAGGRADRERDLLAAEIDLLRLRRVRERHQRGENDDPHPHRLALKKSITARSNAAGSSMQQAWPVPGITTCFAPGISDAVSRPPASDTSWAPLMTSVGIFIAGNRGCMSQPSRARNICAMLLPDRVWAFSENRSRTHFPKG